MSSPEIRKTTSELKNVTPISIWTNMKNCQLPWSIWNMIRLQRNEMKWTFVLCYVFKSSWTTAFVWSSSALPFLCCSKTSAVRKSTDWSSITSQTQSVCKIALPNQASCCSAQCCFISVLSLVKSLVHMSFKTDFIKCSISKWAPQHSRKAMATLAVRGQHRIKPTYGWKFKPVVGSKWTFK